MSGDEKRVTQPATKREERIAELEAQVKELTEKSSELEMTKENWSQLFEYVHAANTLREFLQNGNTTWSDLPAAKQFVEVGNRMPPELWFRFGVLIGESIK